MDQQDNIRVFLTKIRVNFPKNGNRHSACDQMCYIFALHIEPNEPTGIKSGCCRLKSGSIFQQMGIGILRRIKCATYLHYILSPNGPAGQNRGVPD